MNAQPLFEQVGIHGGGGYSIVDFVLYDKIEDRAWFVEAKTGLSSLSRGQRAISQAEKLTFPYSPKIPSELKGVSVGIARFQIGRGR